MVREGTFREDLYFRLNVVQIKMPPLRDRSEDLPVLLNHFLQEFAKENEIEAPTFEPGAMQCLRRYSWPGNIRELRNFAENAVVLHRGSVIHDYDLEAKFRGESRRIDGERVIVSPWIRKRTKSVCFVRRWRTPKVIERKQQSSWVSVAVRFTASCSSGRNWMWWIGEGARASIKRARRSRSTIEQLAQGGSTSGRVFQAEPGESRNFRTHAC